MTPNITTENLTKLLLIQSMVGQMPHEEAIFEHVCAGLAEMPGVAGVEVRDPEETIEPEQDEDVHRFALQLEERTIAEIVIRVDDERQFKPYLSYIKNLCFSVAVALEERRLRRVTEIQHRELERRVEERTRQLTEEVKERESAEEALREKQKDLDHAQAVAQIGNWRLDVRRDKLVWSDEVFRIFGIEKTARLSYADFLSRVHPDDRGYVDAQWAEALKGKPYDIDHRIIAEGRVKWVREKAELEIDENGDLLGGFGTVQDITDRKRLEFDLLASMKGAEEANRVKTQFLANMSHELRTPLTVIMGALQLLVEATASSERERLLEMASGSAEQLLCIISDLLDFSCLDAGSLKIEKETFDLHQTLRSTVEMFTESARQKGLEIDLRISPELPEKGYGDVNRIRQVLLNLLGNAVKFTERGSITVTAFKKGDSLQLAVRDTGMGIAKEKRKDIFAPFTQVDGSMTRPYGGTGLGLAISRELVHLMGGEIGVESEPGEGSTFWISLPLETDWAAGKTQEDQQQKRPGEPIRVLLAEDEPTVRDLVKLVLGRKGIEVATAENGRQAIEQCGRGRFDLILMDLQMPEMDGLEATRRIRQMEGQGQRRACIFALTAHTRPEDREKCLRAGMDGFLSKPIKLEDLDRAIRECPCNLPEAGIRS